MCGIVGAVAQRDVVPILMEGLRRLEYRGYDSAGIAVIDDGDGIRRLRRAGKVEALEALVRAEAPRGRIGIAHTRWATHGPPTERNAHPHVSQDSVAVVHNGIIENHAELRGLLEARGYAPESDTDTEIIAHLIHHHLQQGASLAEAVRASARELEGAFALGVLWREHPDRLIAARQGTPLVVGVGVGEHFIASDVSALIPVTQQFIHLEEGDVAEVTRESVVIYDRDGRRVERPITVSEFSADAVERGSYRHYMLKEIHEQPAAIEATFEGRIGGGQVLERSFGPEAPAIFDAVQGVQIVACGTSYHAGLVARHWFEELARVPCQVEVASEFRYRNPVVRPNTLFVSISQSGETADTLAAVRIARELGYLATLGIVNVPESTICRESDLVLMTRAGPEIGVASTKAFTTQLVALLLLVAALGRRHGLGAEVEERIVQELRSLPALCRQALALDEPIARISEAFVHKEHALFLGRGLAWPIAMEGALKLKEISYIHAEAYPAGELKHGPLALVDENMPVVAVAPRDDLVEKLESNLQEVRARGGELFVFADHSVRMPADDQIHVLEFPSPGSYVAPIIHTLPLQLLAYHVAVLKGTDVDRPRNLAKSVTVE